MGPRGVTGDLRPFESLPLGGKSEGGRGGGPASCPGIWALSHTSLGRVGVRARGGIQG